MTELRLACAAALVAFAAPALGGVAEGAAAAGAAGALEGAAEAVARTPHAAEGAEPGAASLGAEVDRCGALAAADARLQCFDAIARARQSARAAGKQEGALAASPALGASSPVAGPAPGATSPATNGPSEPPSRVERRWDLDDEASRGAFALLPDEANYLLPATYNFRPNQQPFPPQILDVKPVEAKFQVSFKLKLAENPFGSPGDLWMSYTQKSFWQVYAGDQSAPFRETNYNPGLSYVVPAKADVLGLKLRALALTVDHESNGRGAGLTRSWNRLAGTAVFERGEFVGMVSAWVTQGTDDNPDITDYLGHGRVTVGWRRNGHALSLTVRNPFDFDDGRLGAEASWTFPLPFTRRAKGYLQYDYGYGESLLDYDVIGSRIGIGFALSEPL